MIVVGGTYTEQCSFPQWERIYGSGLRAAVGLGVVSPGSVLHTYVCRASMPDVRATLTTVGVAVEATEIPEQVVFDYFHPLDTPRIRGVPKGGRGLITVRGDAVLRFGMIEGDAKVMARRAVYDPQRPVTDSRGELLSDVRFGANGSEAKQLVYVLRDTDLLPLGSKGDVLEVVARLVAEEEGCVVIARHALGGASVYVGEAPAVEIPAYEASAWSKIGSGDVFCAAFAHHWAERGLAVREAADLASRSVAFFNDGHRLPLPPAEDLMSLTPLSVGPRPGPVRIVASALSLAQRYLLETAWDALAALGNEVLHGSFGDGADVTTSSGEDAACSMLALVDADEPMIDFQIGFARARGRPIVVLAERRSVGDLTMFEGTGCEVVGDLTTAIYRAHVASLRVSGDRTLP